MCIRDRADLEPADICLSDLNGKILIGDRDLTSELLLHLEIFKANPKARAVVHCHPPYATAFAIAGTVPPNGYLPEYEVFIGPAAIAPYDTPGTQAFAETVLPFVEQHNTILLKNHGVVCWSDSATHAEWLCEIIDTYCKSYLIALQIGRPLAVIPDDKIDDILRRKRLMGLPDARMGRIEMCIRDRFIVGHTLVWHSQTPAWVFQDDHGNPTDRDTLLKRMHDHISAVVGRYKGRIQSWDVVNEALNDDGTLRKSPWLKIIGEDYILKAYQFAHEADPQAQLNYNDYSLETAVSYTHLDVYKRQVSADCANSDVYTFTSSV